MFVVKLYGREADQPSKCVKVFSSPLYICTMYICTMNYEPTDNFLGGIIPFHTKNDTKFTITIHLTFNSIAIKL